jgi:hypothetical protein
LYSSSDVRSRVGNKYDDNQQQLVGETVKQGYSNKCRINHQKTECGAKCKQYAINAQYTISTDRPKEKMMGKTA